MNAVDEFDWTEVAAPVPDIHRLGHFRAWVQEIETLRLLYEEYSALGRDRKVPASTRLAWRGSARITREHGRRKIRRLAKLMNEGFV